MDDGEGAGRDEALEARVLEAARALHVEHGAGFTMEQLEARAGVSRATLYRRVGRKRAILARLAEARGERFATEDVRATILRATRVVLGRHGMIGATMEQIAAQAEVGVATVYRHFESKDGVLRAFVAEMTPRAAVRSAAMRPTEDVRGDLERMLTPMLTFFHENRDILRLMLAGGEAERAYLDTLRARSDSSVGRLSAYMAHQQEAGRLRRDQAPEEQALALAGMILAFAVFGPMHYGRAMDDAANTARRLAALFVEGATAQDNTDSETDGEVCDG